MIGKGERRGEIGRTRAGRTVDAGLKGVALAATQPLRQAPIGAGAGERETRDRVGREVIIKTRGEADGAPGEIMAADHGRITRGAGAAAIGATPRGPARLINRHRRGAP